MAATQLCIAYCGLALRRRPPPLQQRQHQQPQRRLQLLPRRPLLQQLPLLLLLLVLPLLLPGLPGARADLLRYYGNVTYPLDEQLAYCDTLGPLYEGIMMDLAPWNTSSISGSSSSGINSSEEGNSSSSSSSSNSSADGGSNGAGGGGGISREALELAIAKYTTRGSQKGVALAFYGGVPYVIDEPKLSGLGHHVNILFTYMLVMLDLARQYGSSSVNGTDNKGLIPDVEFVIASSDKPLVLRADYLQQQQQQQGPGVKGAGGPLPPVMRFCSSDEHADIKIPIFHFYTKKYTHNYLANAPKLAAAYPWEAKKPVVFGRFSKYYRHIHPAATSTLKRGARNSSICRQESAFTLTCPVRAHFMEWAARGKHADVIDVKSGPRVSLAKHAAYKYLLHLDGQALSSRLEQLMPLGSLIFKEDSGYKTFYYHLMRPYEHYVPVWKAGGGPEDVLEALEWAAAHDTEARRMAAAAQQVALTYLSKRARSCYWLRLLQAYASLQSYRPVKGARGRYLVPVADYLEDVGRSWERGKQLHKIEY